MPYIPPTYKPHPHSHCVTFHALYTPDLPPAPTVCSAPREAARVVLPVERQGHLVQAVQAPAVHTVCILGHRDLHAGESPPGVGMTLQLWTFGPGLACPPPPPPVRKRSH